MSRMVSIIFILGGTFLLLASLLLLGTPSCAAKPIVATADYENLEHNVVGIPGCDECSRGFVVSGNGLKPYGINDGNLLSADEVTNHSRLVSNQPDFVILSGPEHPFRDGCTVCHVAHVFRTGLTAREFTEETRKILVECHFDRSGLYGQYKRDCVFADYEPFPFVLLTDVCGQVSFVHPTRVYAIITEIINKNTNHG